MATLVPLSAVMLAALLVWIEEVPSLACQAPPVADWVARWGGVLIGLVALAAS